MKWRICLVVLPADPNHFKIVPCDTDMLVLDACCLCGVVGGGEVFAKVKTLFVLGLSAILEVLGEAFRLERRRMRPGRRVLAVGSRKLALQLSEFCFSLADVDMAGASSSAIAVEGGGIGCGSVRHSGGKIRDVQTGVVGCLCRRQEGSCEPWGGLYNERNKGMHEGRGSEELPSSTRRLPSRPPRHARHVIGYESVWVTPPIGPGTSAS